MIDTLDTHHTIFSTHIIQYSRHTIFSTHNSSWSVWAIRTRHWWPAMRWYRLPRLVAGAWWSVRTTRLLDRQLSRASLRPLTLRMRLRLEQYIPRASALNNLHVTASIRWRTVSSARSVASAGCAAQLTVAGRQTCGTLVSAAASVLSTWTRIYEYCILYAIAGQADICPAKILIDSQSSGHLSS